MIREDVYNCLYRRTVADVRSSNNYLHLSGVHPVAARWDRQGRAFEYQKHQKMGK